MTNTRVRDTIAAASTALRNESTPLPEHVEYLYGVSDEIDDHAQYQLLSCALHLLDRVAMFADHPGVLLGLGHALRGVAVAWAELNDLAPPEDDFVADVE